jgi:hypothetical protein
MRTRTSLRLWSCGLYAALVGCGDSSLAPAAEGGVAVEVGTIADAGVEPPEDAGAADVGVGEDVVVAGPDARAPAPDATARDATASPDATVPPSRLCQAPPTGEPLAFPCAEGFGARARGGRGGDVYHVTTLADSGAGSLRQGITSASGPRTIVFDVGGTIQLRSTLVIDGDFLTIAGQTAPGDGITLRDYSVDLRGASHIVVRYLRLRRGDVRVRAAGDPRGSAGLDTVSIDDSHDIIFDHVSASWSCDEIFGVVQNRGVTIQWSIVSEPLGDPPLHPYGDNHAFGLNTSANTLSFHHSLVANYVMRGPQFEANDATNGQGYDVWMEAVNNVLFDYKSSGSRYTTGIEDNAAAASRVDFRFHFLGNTYLRRARSNGPPEIDAETRHGVSSQVRVHVAGNVGPSRPNDTGDEWAVVYADDAPIARASASIRRQMSSTPLFTTPVPVTPRRAADAYALVLATPARAGCATPWTSACWPTCGAGPIETICARRTRWVAGRAWPRVRRRPTATAMACPTPGSAPTGWTRPSRAIVTTTPTATATPTSRRTWTS